MKTLIAASVLACGLLSATADAKDPWTTLNESAPRSVFDEIKDTAPRSIFDDLRETAPRAAENEADDYVGERLGSRLMPISTPL
jgi:hypothetical protein